MANEQNAMMTSVSKKLAEQKVPIEADHHCDEQRVDELEPQIASDDVFHSVVRTPRHPDHPFQDQFGEHTNTHSQQTDHQQVGISLPLPRIESKGLEDRKCQYREADADDSRPQSFILSILHDGRKDTLFRSFLQTIRHI